MKIAYLDCFSGISGDMCLGALIGAGLDLAVLREYLAKLPVSGYEIRQERIRVSGLAAENIVVAVREKDQPERHLGDIKKIIEQSDLAADVKEKSIAVFRCLAGAEARVHGILPEEVHFHEVGAIDAIVDVVGTVAGLSLLGVEKVYASPLPVGHGFIRCRHGLIPSPAPATREVLNNVPVYGTGVETELVTPTGPALAATVTSAFTPLPPMFVEAVGYGSGKTTLHHPNLLRLVLGEAYGGRTPDLSVYAGPSTSIPTGTLIPTGTTVLMKQDATDIDYIYDNYHLYEGEKGFLLSCGVGEALWRIERESTALRVVAADVERPFIATDEFSASGIGNS